MIIRPCTRADFVAFYEKEPPFTLRALCAEQDGKILAIGGYYLIESAAFAFTNQRGMTKRQIVTAGHVFMDYLKALNIQIMAQCGPDGDAAMKHFGFTERGLFYGYAPE